MSTNKQLSLSHLPAALIEQPIPLTTVLIFSLPSTLSRARSPSQDGGTQPVSHRLCEEGGREFRC